MDFDFSHINVPFRMQPGLQRSHEALRLTPLDPAGRLCAEKRAVFSASRSRHCVPGFDPGAALDAISARGRECGVETGPESGTPVELAFEEDFAVLDGATGTLPWLCVCVPSHWAPEDKLGLDAACTAQRRTWSPHAAPGALVTAGDCWERC
jgi:hypothetical protein